MKKPITIGPEKPYQPDSIDYTRVEERASQGYFREYWSAYKGRVRGMLSGVTIGGSIGAATGLAVGLAVSALSGGTLAPLAIGMFAGAGGLMGADMYGAAGSAAASRAAGLAEKHARMIDPVHKGNELSALNDKLMMDGRGHNFQFPESRDKGKYFNWKSGLLGAAIGAGVGALLVGTPILAFLAPIGLGMAGTAVGTALATGALGLTFGLDRSNLKTIFNQVDANSDGKIYHGQGPDLGRAQFRVIENDKQIDEHRLRRQESTFALEEEYHNKIFSGSVKGMFKGFAGGATAGALIGGAIGLVAVGVATVAGFGLPLALTAATLGGAGALYGMKIFADAGREAGAESTARAIDNEFERNQQLRERGINPPAPQKAPEHYLNIKAALLMGTIGVAVAVMMPVLGVAAAHIAGASTAAFLSGPAMAAAAAVGGVFGAMYGVTRDSMSKVSQATDYLYQKSFVVHNDPASQPYVAPPSTQPELTAEQNKSLQNSITSEDMHKLNGRLEQRQKSFESTLLTQQAQTATPTI